MHRYFCTLRFDAVNYLFGGVTGSGPDSDFVLGIVKFASLHLSFLPSVALLFYCFTFSSNLGVLEEIQHWGKFTGFRCYGVIDFAVIILWGHYTSV